MRTAQTLKPSSSYHAVSENRECPTVLQAGILDQMARLERGSIAENPWATDDGILNIFNHAAFPVYLASNLAYLLSYFVR